MPNGGIDVKASQGSLASAMPIQHVAAAAALHAGEGGGLGTGEIGWP